MSTQILNYEMIEDRMYPGDYRVEAIGPDGEVYVCIFSGPDAEQRAHEYADWKNSSARANLAKAN